MTEQLVDVKCIMSLLKFSHFQKNTPPDQQIKNTTKQKQQNTKNKKQKATSTQQKAKNKKQQQKNKHFHRAAY